MLSHSNQPGEELVDDSNINSKSGWWMQMHYCVACGQWLGWKLAPAWLDAEREGPTWEGGIGG